MRGNEDITSPHPTPLISVKDVRKWFPLRRGFTEFITRKPSRYIRAVDGVSFDIRKNEIFVIVGESGCGKTTTAKILLKALEPDGGRVLFEGKDITPIHGSELKQYRRKAQMIFQDPYSSLNPRMKALDSLMEPLLIHNISSSYEERIEKVTQALEEVRLVPVEDFLYRYPHMLSGGQRQRLAVARALLLKPSFIVADEPVSMLDLSIRAEILELLRSLRDKHGITYLYITHDLSTTRYIADRIAIMYLGKIVELGSMRDVLYDAKHPYTQALLDAVPDPDPSNRLKERVVRIKGEIPHPTEIPSGCSLHPRCPYAMNICPLKEPELLEGTSGHYVACYLYPSGRPLAESEKPSKFSFQEIAGEVKSKPRREAQPHP